MPSNVYHFAEHWTIPDDSPEAVWRVIYADGDLDHNESSLVRRLSGLLYVPDQDAGLARQRVTDEPRAADDPSPPGWFHTIFDTHPSGAERVAMARAYTRRR